MPPVLSQDVVALYEGLNSGQPAAVEFVTVALTAEQVVQHVIPTEPAWQLPESERRESGNLVLAQQLLRRDDDGLPASDARRSRGRSRADRPKTKS